MKKNDGRKLFTRWAVALCIAFYRCEIRVMNWLVFCIGFGMHDAKLPRFN